MGQGEDIDATDATPWQNAMEHFTGIAAANWAVSMTDIAPPAIALIRRKRMILLRRKDEFPNSEIGNEDL